MTTNTRGVSRLPAAPSLAGRLQRLLWSGTKAVSGVVLTLVLFMASTDPDTVTGNLAKWWGNASGAHAPDWLVSRAADKVVQRAGVLGITVGIVWFLWSRRWFRRFRHLIMFTWRRAVSTEVWIAKDAAIRQVHDSPWAQSRKKRNEKPKSIFGLQDFLMENPEKQAKDRMFYDWIKLVLKQFAEHDPESVREVENGKEYNEVKLNSLWVTFPAACGVSPIDWHLQTAIPRRLRRGSFIEWLSDRYNNDLISEFGNPT